MKKNLAAELEKNFDKKILNVFKKISILANDTTTQVFLVGGIVRDLMLNKKNFDIDIIVEGNAIEFTRKLIIQEQNFHLKEIQQNLCTAKVIIDGKEMDFASTRLELYPQKGHLPQIEKIGVTIAEDSIRRDFSCNALYLSLNSQDWGEIYDFHNGLDSINKKELSVLHEESFIDDPTRIIRGLKFAQRFDFELDKKTQDLQNAYLENINSNMSYSRLKSELIQGFGLNFSSLAHKFIEQKIYKLIAENIINITNFEKLQRLIAKYCPKSENIWLIYFCVIFLPALIKNEITKLNFTQKEMNLINSIIALHTTKKIQFLKSSDVFSFFNNHKSEAIVAYSFLNDCKNAELYLNELKDVTIEITGQDLMKLGLSPSPIFKKILNKIRNAKLNREINTKEEELNLAKKLINKKATE